MFMLMTLMSMSFESNSGPGADVMIIIGRDAVA